MNMRIFYLKVVTTKVIWGREKDSRQVLSFLLFVISRLFLDRYQICTLLLFLRISICSLFLLKILLPHPIYLSLMLLPSPLLLSLFRTLLVFHYICFASNSSVTPVEITFQKTLSSSGRAKRVFFCCLVVSRSKYSSFSATRYL